MSCTGYISCIGPPAFCDPRLALAIIAGYGQWLLTSVAGDIGSLLISVIGRGASWTPIVAGVGTSPLFGVLMDCRAVTWEASSRVLTRDLHTREKLSGTADLESRGVECSRGGILQSDVCCRSVFKNTEKSSV